jgi:2-polyprenyl-3-methyl-5-hydroxy-6-metoxy-1,4-benzoquinol methylase
MEEPRHARGFFFSMKRNSIKAWKHRFFILRRMGAARLYRKAGARNIRWQPHELFSIKPGYHHATTVEAFDDTGNTDEWQRRVYELAAGMAQSLPNPSIIDVGCGSAWKLIHQLGQYRITGIEVAPTLQWLQTQYPEHNWLLFDDAAAANLQADIVICSDVIEHIENPDNMMDFLSAINFRYLVISTPERDACSGKDDFGPPVNTAHFREWNAPEFRNYVQRWFNVQEQHIFNDKSITQVIICYKK